ncbi:extracellular solute-binding protein [Clostridium sp. AF19-22AC]|jgi:multiple sugar transport system substrate-binding protein|uniref:Carbohydrate ABC transporter substrate-binding protein (CUT1 family) n=1 Tax=Faecalicatena orotica TaxID=1544 RepID=A0A2Y9C9R1_9FIRM|nr:MULTISPECIES: sugar ABC transporter substrate-binding protein [Clostridia]PWJ31521.1 carbohydrate ABC transporter substrate-binding protein (CUT1 family) [Faecalicatena orotica]RHR21298.1 extracellular solute-binding protein [Clostridium sp. AF19-22AC]SSA54729.1 carbohydrate ABC transporter substrate-binding protein, CUT1 family [Faecalicatena orotica]
MKKRILALLVCAAMVISMTACGGSSDKKAEKEEGGSKDGKTELTLLRLGDLTKAEPIFKPIVESFEQENPGVKVNFEAMAWAEATTKLKLLGAQGDLPDVTFTNIANGWDLASEGYLMDLSDMLASDETMSAELPQSVIDIATTEDGKMYWVPAATGAFGLWYNKDLYKQAGLDPETPPKTVEDMVSYAKTITEKTGVPGLGWGISATEDFANVVESFYSSYTGTDIWSDKDKCFTFEKDDKNRKLFAEALDELAAITNDYGITQANVIEYNPYAIRTLFRDGEVGMYLDGVWAVKELLDELNKGEESKFNTGLFPEGPAGSHPIMGCDGWAIPEACKNKDEAWKLIQHLMSSDNQTRHASQWGLLPILESEKGKEEFSGEYWNALVEQEQTVASRPKDKNVAMIEQAVADGAQAAATRKMSANEAIDYMIETVNSNYSD